MIIHKELDYKHLFAPVWLVGEIHVALRQSPMCGGSTFPKSGSSPPNS